MDLWEWGSMADMEKSYAKFDADPTLVKFVTEFWTYVVPGPHREEIWKPRARTCVNG